MVRHWLVNKYCPGFSYHQGVSVYSRSHFGQHVGTTVAWMVSCLAVRLGLRWLSGIEVCLWGYIFWNLLFSSWMLSKMMTSWCFISQLDVFFVVILPVDNRCYGSCLSWQRIWIWMLTCPCFLVEKSGGSRSGTVKHVPVKLDTPKISKWARKVWSSRKVWV